MSLNITARSFSGKYGADSDIGDIIHAHIDIVPGDICSMNKEIIFLVDISGSMQGSMKKVKSSLLAFRDSIVGKSPMEMETLGPEERDRLYRNTIRTRLITFSNDAKEAWSSSDSDATFESVVLSLRSEAMTNMGDALKMAFQKTERSIFTWIIAFTDGESNQGPCHKADSFRKLAAKKPLNSKIVSLGYGNRFDPEVLNVIGTFVYVENSEMIPVVLGNLAEEIMTSIAFNCVIDIPGSSLPVELTEDTIIVPEGEDDSIPGRIIIGDRVVGPLCYGKSYDYVYLPHGNNCSRSLLDRYVIVNIRFTDIITGDDVTVDYNITHTNEEPSEQIWQMFFDSEKRRLIYRLYKALQNHDSRTLKKEIKMIRRTVEKWADEVAESHKDEILKMIQDIERQGHRQGRNHHANTALNMASCSGYDVLTRSDDSLNGSSDGYAELTVTAARYYMASPLINN